MNSIKKLIYPFLTFELKDMFRKIALRDMAQSQTQNNFFEHNQCSIIGQGAKRNAFSVFKKILILKVSLII